MPASSARSRRNVLPFGLAAIVATLVRAASRASGRGGSSLPGKTLLWLHPGALRKLRRQHRGRVVLVSATNGKTTLTAMLAGMCSDAGLRVAHNMTGANLRSGLATTLLLSRRQRPDVVLLETDEATLPLVAPDLQPDAVVLANLFRDQLDRYGELESLADRWRETLAELDPARVRVAYNVDDPLIAELVDTWLARTPDATAVGFGLGDSSVAAAGLPHAADSKFCRRCHHPLQYRHSFVGHLGDWSCTNCGFSRPQPVVATSEVVLDGLAASSLVVTIPGSEVRTRLRIPGLYNVYNAVAAAAGAAAIGIPAASIEAGLSGFSPAFGRFERIPVPGTGSLTLLLVKNPTGLNEVIRTLLASGVDLGATLVALNDGIADGRDTSWIWDADVEPLLAAAPALVLTGDRAAEFALRAVYGGFPSEALIVEEDLEAALFLLLERARDFAEHGHAYALVTYTAMLKLREVITKQGWARSWHAATGTAAQLEAASRR